LDTRFKHACTLVQVHPHLHQHTYAHIYLASLGGHIRLGKIHVPDSIGLQLGQPQHMGCLFLCFIYVNNQTALIW